MQLANARKEVEVQKRLKRRLGQIKSEVRKLRTRFRRLTATLKKAEKDVKELKGFGIKRLWASLVGERSRRLRKEEREYARLRVLVDDIDRDGRALKKEHDGLRARLKRLGDVEGRYRRLLAKKERSLGKGAASRQLSKIAEDLGRMEAYQEQIDEGITACKRARSGLTQIITLLEQEQSARSRRGGSCRSAEILSRARTLARRVRVYLRSLDRELKDVGMRFKAKVPSGSIAIAKAVSEYRSLMSPERARSVLRKVRRFHTRLLAEKKSWKKEIQELRDRRRQLIHDA